MISILLIKQIAQLFLMILMGYILVKTDILKSKDSKTISVIVLYLVMPCVIINSFQVDYTVEKRNGLILSVVVALLIHIIFLIVDIIFKKMFKLDVIERASNMYSNAGNLIIPIVAAILGDEWVLYSCGFMSVQLVFLWTHCKMLISQEKQIDIKKILTNINLICVIIGIILFISGIRLPEVINGTISSVAKLVAPLSMIVSGMLMADIELKSLFVNKRIYLVVFMRMVVYPVLVLVFLKLSNVQSFVENGYTILLITFLATMTPSASTVTQMAQVYDNNSDYANRINILTVLVCIVTMPIMIMFYEMIM